TTTQIGDWVRQVAGDAVTVHQILQPNTDPHEYEPRPNDVIAAHDAAVVFRSGEGLDDWVYKIAGSTPVRTLVASEGRSPGDPHWWHDPRNVEHKVQEMAQALSQVDPQDRAIFARNAAAYVAKLKRLDRRIAACMSAVPASERKLVTDHDAFRY